MENNPVYKNFNKIALSIFIGFGAGALIGVIIGYIKKDIAVWLSVGIGSGIALGYGIGEILNYKFLKRKK